MAVKFSKSPKAIAKNIANLITNAISRYLNAGAQLMAKQIDLSYENRGRLKPESPRLGAPVWRPTSRAAKMNRKNYPQGGGKTGKKGFTQAQARYLFAAPTLEDTGRMRSGIGIETDDKGMIKARFIGTDVPYIKTHEEGGKLTVNGTSFDVPQRQSQIITDNELANLTRLFIDQVGK